MIYIVVFLCLHGEYLFLWGLGFSYCKKVNADAIIIISCKHAQTAGDVLDGNSDPRGTNRQAKDNFSIRESSSWSE